MVPAYGVSRQRETRTPLQAQLKPLLRACPPILQFPGPVDDKAWRKPSYDLTVLGCSSHWVLSSIAEGHHFIALTTLMKLPFTFFFSCLGAI